MQAAITAFARETGMRIMGPNCNGLVNFIDGFAMTTSATVATRRPAGNVGVVAQSGGAGQVNVMWRAQEAGVGISYEVSCGNSADLNILDFMRFMIDDAATDVIMVLAEQYSRRSALHRSGAARRRTRKAHRHGQARPHRGGQPCGGIAYRRNGGRRRRVRRGAAPMRHHPRGRLQRVVRDGDAAAHAALAARQAGGGDDHLRRQRRTAGRSRRESRLEFPRVRRGHAGAARRTCCRNTARHPIRPI